MAYFLCGSFHGSAIHYLSQEQPHLEQANCFSPVWVFTRDAGLQIITLAEYFVIYRAGKWLLLCGFFVTLQMTTLAECIVTYGTGKWSLSCVNIFMNCQIGIILKCSVTLVVIIFSMLLEVKNCLTTMQQLQQSLTPFFKIRRKGSRRLNW